MNEWDLDFKNYINELRKHKMVIVGGDMNLCHHRIDTYRTSAAELEKIPGNTLRERESFDRLLESGWVDTFRRLNPNTRAYI